MMQRPAHLVRSEMKGDRKQALKSRLRRRSTLLSF
jgi:hypothetical protein